MGHVDDPAWYPRQTTMSGKYCKPNRIKAPGGKTYVTKRVGGRRIKRRVGIGK